MSSDDPTNQLNRRQALSALVDGECSGADQALRAWHDDAGARADWHAHHLIGELMRSDEVRCDPLHDARFLGRLRERLASEPVALALVPAASARVGLWQRAWAVPMAVAAGFVAVAGVLVVTRVAAPDGVTQDRSALLSRPAAARDLPGLQSVAVGATPSAPGSVDTPSIDGKLIRNAELDRYLAAHQQYSNTSVLPVPGGSVRKAAAVAPGR